MTHRPLANISLRRGLLKQLGLLMLAFTAVSSAIVYQLTLTFSDEAYDEWLLDSARSLGQLLQVKEGLIMVDLPVSTLRAMVFDAHDRVLFRIDSRRQGLIAGQTALQHSAADRDVSYSDQLIDGQPMRVVQVLRHDLMAGDEVSISIGETLHKRQRLASRVLGTVLALSAMLALLTLWLVRDAVTRGLRPLSRLADTIRSRRPGDLTLLPDADVAKELATFTQAINTLLAQLDQAVALQKRFVADAAHQIRTPLAALKVELEHALRESDPERHHAALVDLRHGIDRLARLSTQLLTLARAEPGALTHTCFQPINLYELVHRVTGQHLHASLQKNIDLGFEGEKLPPITGDRLLIEEALNNLIDNALRYAGSGTRVTTRIGQSGSMAWLEIEDDGPGVPEAERDRLTERFHRPPDSPAGGSGLGLSIVKEIAQIHQGLLAIHAVRPHGLRIRLSLPVQAKQVNPP